MSVKTKVATGDSTVAASMPGRLRGRIAVVTAAAMGIGAATARRLAQEGAHVIGMDVHPGVEAVVQNLREEGLSADSRLLDCTKAADVERAFDEVHSVHGRLDVLVNAVGRSARERMSEFWCSDPSTWDLVLDTSLRSTLLCTRQVAKGMRERKSGRIVNISSVVWLGVPPSNVTEYAAAKAGVVGFTRALAVELAPHGVTVNAVSPGLIRTIALQGIAPGILERMQAAIPMGHAGEPEDIAAGIAFLVSDDAKFITGHNLVISGGRAMV